jgi:membrane fusion protein (multidrug efflux system)
MSDASTTMANKRRKGLQIIGGVVVAAALLWSAWYFVFSRHHATTDNAYVIGNVLQITPQVGGTVVSIEADETDFVKAGQALVKLDKADAKVALEQAQSQLAQTVREVRSLFTNSSALDAQVKLREADALRAEVELSRTQEDVNRRAPLVSTGAVSKEEFQHASAQLDAAKNSAQAAQAALNAAREQLKSGQTQTDGTSVKDHPNVARAAAKMREAYLAYQRSDVLAPTDGHIAKRSVQVGQRVQAGMAMMTMVALNQLWVDANFKESQLQELRIGQPAELLADVYGKNVVFHGKVAGLGAGTGAAFSLLPAQNATGNWIKVVQRVPVRILLDPQELSAHPLRVGLSMDVNVDTSDTSGKTLADVQRASPASATTIYDSLQAAADAEVQRIIAANMGQSSKAP